MSVPVVAIVRGEDKFALLEEAARRAGFWEHVEAAWVRSNKPREEFLIAIKPNLMILMSARAPEVATDPALVEHLIRLLRERGFRNLKVVESQNTMSNWLQKRTVRHVAQVAGYTGQGYEIVDLSLEKEPYIYKVRGLGDWRNYVGHTWREADYRIDFAKFKTQTDTYFTLCLKNEFGALPLVNKYRHYHTWLPYWACTLYTLVNFPVHFGFVDAYWASDGMAGFAIQYAPKLLKRMMASENILALDLAGARLMGLEPWDAPLPRFVMRHLGEPEYIVDGDATPLTDWENVPEDIQNLVDVAQAVYMLANPGAMLGILNVDTREFPPRFPLMRWYYQLLNSILLLLYGKRLTPREHQRVVGAIVREARTRARSRQIAG